MFYSPEQHKKNAYILSLLFFIAAFTALFTASLTPSRALMQLIAVGCITGGIFILARYALQTFVYRLDDADSETNDLTVHRIQGKRSTAVCRLSLAGLIGLEKKTDTTDLTKHGKITSRHHYTVNLSPASTYLLYFKEQDSLLLIQLECNDAFADAIRRRATGL